MSIPMTWEQICDDPNLRDLPYRIEQDRYGRIVMSPVKPGHGRYQGKIAHLLHTWLPGWAIFVECAVATAEGVKAPDIAAMPPDRFPNWNDVSQLPITPDLCVEVLSWSNSAEEMNEKRELLAARGCREFWTCSEDGQMTFLDAGRGAVLQTSVLCPDFPKRVSLP